MRYLYILLLVGCNNNPYAIDDYLNVTHYSINYTQITPQGQGVDANGALSLTDIDRRTDEVEACLIKLFPDGQLPTDVITTSHCIIPKFNPHIQRHYVGVKLAPDWYRGCYDQSWQYVGPGNGEEMFPANVDPALCMAKGFVPTPECPCGERAAIQDNDAIVVAPNMHLYKSELIRLVTGCNNIWTTILASCYSPD